MLCAVVNNGKTYHFGTLLVHLVESLKSCPPDIQELPMKSLNTVYFTRVFIKYFTEHATGDQILGLIQDGPSSSKTAGEGKRLLFNVACLCK